jgi:ribosome-associated toxin RatA of RatAB toxin-antitoxin module
LCDADFTYSIAPQPARVNETLVLAKLTVQFINSRKFNKTTGNFDKMTSSVCVSWEGDVLRGLIFETSMHWAFIEVRIECCLIIFMLVFDELRRIQGFGG